MTIWYFGDSFIRVINPKQSKYSKLINFQWTEKVSKRINQPFNAFGGWGGNLEHTYEQFNENRDRIKRNDIVIICLGPLYERWLFREHPEYNFFDPPQKNLARAKKYFKQYLNDHKELYHNALINFLFNVQEITTRLKLHTIIIASHYCSESFLSKEKHRFKKLHIADGSLINVSLHEYHETFAKKIKEIVGCGRHNHLSVSNHKILAKKLIKNIQEKIPINLKTEFKKHFITEEKHNDPLFKKKEYCSYYKSKVVYKL